MKKYLLTVGLALLVPAVMAMDGKKPEREEGSSATITTTVFSKIDPTQELNSFKNNPENFKYSGGMPIFGIFAQQAPKIEAVEALMATFYQHYNTLLDQLAIANECLKNTHTVERALKEAQENVDYEKEKCKALEAAKREVEDKLIVAETLNTHFKQEQIGLLTKMSQQDITLGMNQERQKLLEEQNSQLKGVVSELSEHEGKIDALLAENQACESTLLTMMGDGDEIEKTRQAITARIKSNANKIIELKGQCQKLGVLKDEKEQQIEGLKKAIEANDYYTQVLKKIRDQSVSDDDLALFIFSVQTIQGVDLDVLSQGRDQRLIEVLIKTSRPYEPRPSSPDQITSDYDAGSTPRFRYLGNKFIAGGGSLAWKGRSFKMEDCIFAGSKFERRAAKVAAKASESFSKKESK